MDNLVKQKPSVEEEEEEEDLTAKESSPKGYSDIVSDVDLYVPMMLPEAVTRRKDCLDDVDITKLQLKDEASSFSSYSPISPRALSLQDRTYNLSNPLHQACSSLPSTNRPNSDELGDCVYISQSDVNSGPTAKSFPNFKSENGNMSTVNYIDIK